MSPPTVVGMSDPHDTFQPIGLTDYQWDTVVDSNQAHEAGGGFTLVDQFGEPAPFSANYLYTFKVSSVLHLATTVLAVNNADDPDLALPGLADMELLDLPSAVWPSFLLTVAVEVNGRLVKLATPSIRCAQLAADVDGAAGARHVLIKLIGIRNALVADFAAALAAGAPEQASTT
jgi:hypothetical protein